MVYEERDKKNEPVASSFITTHHAMSSFYLQIFGREKVSVCSNLPYSLDIVPYDFWLPKNKNQAKENVLTSFPSEKSLAEMLQIIESVLELVPH